MLYMCYTVVLSQNNAARLYVLIWTFSFWCFIPYYARTVNFGGDLYLFNIIVTDNRQTFLMPSTPRIRITLDSWSELTDDALVGAAESTMFSSWRWDHDALRLTLRTRYSDAESVGCWWWRWEHDVLTLTFRTRGADDGAETTMYWLWHSQHASRCDDADSAGADANANADRTMC